LRGREVCAGDLQAQLHQRQAYISQQLMALRAAGIVTCRKEGLRAYYRLNDTHLLELLDEVKASVASREEG
jgi:DNA-binding transcriptional ArsR family regulator